jgi:hypothetical protein
MRTLYPRQLLHIEGAALLAAATVLYAQSDGSWWLYALLFFAPDLAMVGYMAGGRIGAIVYNLAHTVSVPLVLGMIGIVVDSDLAIQVALIWTAHIGFDRLLGYGLKYPDGFKETHLGRV